MSEPMFETMSRRLFFSFGLVAGAAVALGQPALARGGPDPEDRLTARQKRALEEERRKARQAAREQRELERRKIKR